MCAEAAGSNQTVPSTLGWLEWALLDPYLMPFGTGASLNSADQTS